MGRSPCLGVFLLTMIFTIDAFALPSLLSPTSRLAATDDRPIALWMNDASPGSLPVIYADPPRLPGPPAAAVSEGGGWLSRWLSMGGEGDLNVVLSKAHNITLPHRPAAFPSQLIPPMMLPISGIIVPFTSLRNLKDATESSETLAYGSFPEEADEISRVDHSGTRHRRLPTLPMAQNPELGCIPPLLPPRYEIPPRPWKIVLVERGGCDFASKVRAAQERGAAAVVVGDGKLREDETDEEGRLRVSLITMFSPEDTDAIFIPSVFVSRASYLILRDLLSNGTTSKGYDAGLWVELGQGSDEGATLSSLLSFALLMPTLFLLVTIAVHRIRVARQREADRAPPLLVLSLPERIWTPDIVWEKDSNASSPLAPSTPIRSTSPSDSASTIPPPPPITPFEVATPPAVDPESLPEPSGSRKKSRSKSGSKPAKKYFSRDECAICMDSFQRGDVVRILPCGHVFHKEECDEWLLKWRKLCPTCRADVTLPSGEVGAGTTLTPVSNVTVPVPAHQEPRSTAYRFNGMARDGWHRITGRRNGQVALTETTPLITTGQEVERHAEV